MFTRIATLIIAGSAAVFAAAQPLATTQITTLESQVDALFKNFDKPSSPGCAVAADQNDRAVYRRAYGKANLEQDIALTPTSVFEAASVSKQFTAAAILLLAGDGKLSLDDDVRKYVPELQDVGSKITIRHLAHHTSGIRDQEALLNLAGWRYSEDLITVDHVFKLLARQQDLNFRPGERHLYSNSGYTLLARIVARVSGQSFREFTTDRIFKPLGMVNTHFRDSSTEIVRGLAAGYAPDRDGFALRVTRVEAVGGSGLLTTVEDLLRWHANFDTGTVGGNRLVDGLLRRGMLNDGRTIGYAFGVQHGVYRGLRTVFHGGALGAFRAWFMRFPEQRFGLAVLCNVATAAPREYARRIADLYLGEKLQPGIDEQSVDAPEVAVAGQQLRAYAGVYLSAAGGAARRITFDNGKLFAINGAQRISLKSLGSGRFRATGTPDVLMFDTGAANGVRRLRIEVLDADSPEELERIDPITPTTAQLAALEGSYRSDEIDSVYHVVVRDGQLTVEREKLPPAVLPPLVSDTFGGQPGVIRFVRDSAGKVSGLEISVLRARHVKFRKDTRSPIAP